MKAFRVLTTIAIVIMMLAVISAYDAYDGKDEKSIVGFWVLEIVFVMSLGSIWL